MHKEHLGYDLEDFTFETNIAKVLNKLDVSISIEWLSYVCHSFYCKEYRLERKDYGVEVVVRLYFSQIECNLSDLEYVKVTQEYWSDGSCRTLGFWEISNGKYLNLVTYQTYYEKRISPNFIGLPISIC